ncbi:AraC family transcriptional regulator [Erysipelotrichaceae bacterium RD49]|nr:AraC family transcriptional regulator [Erysipelotrichaceae bacterium RD49]
MSTEWTVTQAAMECSIENVSYFIKIFTWQFGMTPRKFVQLYRNQQEQ